MPFGSLGLALAGGYLIYRGITGHCGLYQALGISRAKNKGVAVHKSVTINRSAQELFGFWRNFENLPNFMEHLESVKITGERTSHWVARTPVGVKLEWDAEITDELANEMIAWRSLPGADIENEGRVEFRPAPGNMGTVLDVSITYFPPGAEASPAVASLFSTLTAFELAEELRHFKHIMETGETPRAAS